MRPPDRDAGGAVSYTHLAGGIYYWASKLGGPGWGWFTGWFNLIGLVAVVASVDYVCAQFIYYLLGLFNVNFIFNFTSTNVKYEAHVVMALFVLLLLLGLVVNVFWNRLLTLFNGVAVWWNVVGVAVIVVILIVVPSHHASLRYVFGHTINNSGFGEHMYWYYVLPLGFLLTMYTVSYTHLTPSARRPSPPRPRRRGSPPTRARRRHSR